MTPGQLPPEDAERWLDIAQSDLKVAEFLASAGPRAQALFCCSDS